MRALQRAVGPRGLVLWQQNPQRAWVEAFPEGRSYVRRLATKYPYVCPLLGSDLVHIIRQGNLALAQAFYRGGNFQEAADLYTKLMQDSAAHAAPAARPGAQPGPAAALRPGVQAPAHRPGAGRRQGRLHGRLPGPVRRHGQADQPGRQAQEHRLGHSSACPLPDVRATPSGRRCTAISSPRLAPCGCR